ncbi:alpha/beta hydrolase fold domain-containing protein [Planctomicrobium piriforme]|uniref:Acetyl esterase/lipase n=1 Tax=Planctomicrobium piriforme TaxID=1576369 RepID=A0A1I3C9B5_9PLAN|nr:alpha/beta hydrolase fold domain-containing protein [Planctomicrobium piriforme]SFH70769.1 Acetyl esterase/lipase [Planctomicrobium piriforme]
MSHMFRCNWVLACGVIWGLLSTVSFGQVQQFVEPSRLQEEIAEKATAHRDLPYVTDGDARQQLDVYVPNGATGRLPLVIWIHGGGWQNGTKDRCPALAAGLIQQGFVVASIGYRLTDQATFPAQIQDCKAAVRWLRANAEQFHINPERIGVWGSSAGGHLAALLGTCGTGHGFDVGENLNQSSAVQAVCDFYGPSDLVAAAKAAESESRTGPDSTVSKLLGGPVLERLDAAQAASPITYVSKQTPPFLIVHGDQDKRVSLEQSELLFKALSAQGVPSQLHILRGAGHGPGFANPETRTLVREFFVQTLQSGQGLASSAVNVRSESLVPQNAANAEMHDEPAENANRPRGGGMPVEMILKREDANGDGQLSRQEFRGPPGAFDRWDADKDGQLSSDELTKGMAQRQNAAP